jgi:predicted dithiol-disulfide oxidoreductase (DUF899 family)
VERSQADYKNFFRLAKKTCEKCSASSESHQAHDQHPKHSHLLSAPISLTDFAQLSIIQAVMPYNSEWFAVVGSQSYPSKWTSEYSPALQIVIDFAQLCAGQSAPLIIACLQ